MNELRQWTCEGCGATGVQTTRARPRKWCSERCRKRQYDLVCVDCGGRVNGTTPGRMADRDKPVCGQCNQAHYAVWTREAIIACIEDWADEHGGIPPSATDFVRARALGQPVPDITCIRDRFGTWNQAISAAGYEPRRSGPLEGWRPLTVEQRAECARRYAAGESSARIAADLGCAPGAVIRWARRDGVPIRPAFADRRAA